MSWSIRRRLLITLLVILATGLAGGPLVASTLVRDYLDDRAATRVSTFSTSIGGVLSGREQTVLTGEPLATLAGPADLVLIALDADGAAVRTDSRLKPGSPAPSIPALVDAGDGLSVGQTRSVTSGDRTYLVGRTPTDGLILGRQDTTPLDVAGVVIAVDRTEDAAVVRRLERAGFGFAAVAMLLLGGTAAVVLRRGLRPIEQIADAVADDPNGVEVERELDELGRNSAVETTRLAQALVTAFGARRRAEEGLRAFVADASHELRTPLTVIGGWLDLYAQGGLEDTVERERALIRMESEVGRMRILVDELELLARLDQGRELEHRAVQLIPLLHGVVEDARVVSDDRTISLEGTGEPVVLGDRSRLEQVFRNLVGNATQHTPRGTPVRVRATIEDGWVVVRIADEGQGIHATDLKRIFDRSYRAGTARAGGRGLGLAIVRALVRAHGGAVTVTSEPGRGSEFVVTLPTVGAAGTTVSQPSAPA